MPQNSLSVKLKIKNSSDQVLTKTYQDSYQMDEWNFPDTITAGQTVNLTVSLRNDPDIDLSEDFGKVRYRTADNLGELKILAYWLYFNFSSVGRTVQLSPKGNVEIIEGDTVNLTIS